MSGPTGSPRPFPPESSRPALRCCPTVARHMSATSRPERSPFWTSLAELPHHSPSAVARLAAMSPAVPACLVAELPADAVLLDVRENDEWAAGHAPAAVHVPMGQVTQRLDEIAAALPDRPVRVVCRSGARSARVTAYLRQSGWDAVNVDGGMRAWAAAGRPMVTDSNAPPRVI